MHGGGPGAALRAQSIAHSRVLAAFDAENVDLMSAPDVARWPEHYACWDAGSRQLVAFDAPDPARRDQWTAAVRRGIARCGL